MEHLPIKIQQEIYFKTVVRSVTYSILAWGTNSNAVMDATDTLHCRAAKLMHKVKDANLTNEQVMNKVKWQPTSYVYKKRLPSYLHTIYHGNCPHVLVVLFIKERESRTRRNKQFEIKRFKGDW